MVRYTGSFDRMVRLRRLIRSSAIKLVGNPTPAFYENGIISATKHVGRARSLAALIALALSGALVAASASRSGVGLANDSFVYLSTACRLSQGQGLVVSPCVSYEGGGPAALGRGPVPLTHFPPLYPAILAVLGSVGLELRDAARWMNVTLFSVNLAIIGFTLRARCVSPVASLIAMLWMLSSVDLIYLHAMALSEPLSLALGFGELMLLASWLSGFGPRTFSVPIAAASTGLAALTRYAGVAYICAGALGLVIIRWAPRRKRYITSLLFVGIAALPVLLLALHNARIAGGLANRTLGFYALQPRLLLQGLETALSWIIPKELSFTLKVMLAFGVLLLAVRLYVRIRGAVTADSRSILRGSNPRSIEWILACLLSCYLAVVIVSKGFLDCGIPIDSRLLAPVHVALVLLAARAGDDLAERYRLPVRFWVLAFGVLAALLVSSSVVATRFASKAGESGLEYSSLERRSQLLAIVRGLPVGAEVYSNLSAMTSFLADRPVWPLAKAMGSKGAYIAYFDYKSGFPADRLPSDEGSLNRLCTIRYVPDGRLFVLDGRSSLGRTALEESKPRALRSPQTADRSSQPRQLR